MPYNLLSNLISTDTPAHLGFNAFEYLRLKGALSFRRKKVPES